MQAPTWIRKFRSLYALLFGLIGCMGFGTEAGAQTNLACAGVNRPTWTVTFPEFTDNPTIAIGSVLASATVPASVVAASINCANRTGSNRYTQLNLSDLTSDVWGGFTLRALVDGSNTNRSITNYSSAGTYSYSGAGITYQVVKRANSGLMGPCNVSGGQVYIANAGGVYSNVANIQVCGAGFTRLVPTCTVSNTSISIPLGNVAASSFASVGSTSPTSGAQNIGLRCSYSPRVQMTLQGSAISGTTNVMPLTSATGMAGGVGVQILYRTPGAGSGETVLTPGKGVTLSSAAGATLTVPIFARYARTGTVTAGSANASPTLLFEYP